MYRTCRIEVWYTVEVACVCLGSVSCVMLGSMLQMSISC